MKTKKVLALFLTLTLSVSLFSFANANVITEKNHNFSITEGDDFKNVNSNANRKQTGSWILAWSDGISGLVAWDGPND